MDAEKYRHYHEQHMMFNNGTTKEECGILLSTIPFCVFFSLLTIPFLSDSIIPIVEFFIIVLPVILNVTVLSEVNYLVLLHLIILYIAFFMTNLNLKDLKQVLSSKIQGKRSIITNYRASTNFVSAICILAVDFNVFPRRFAKTESFGFGLMDLGVGFFVCSNGFVENRKEQKNQFSKVLKSCCVLFILGIIRLAAVKTTGYQEHVTEYGIHWNFFFTLVFCKIFVHLIKSATDFQNPIWLTLIVGIIHETLLNLGLKEWVLFDKSRDSFLSANKEGVTSCLGYVCIYFAASAIGKFINHPNEITYKKLLVNLIVAGALTWFGTSISFRTIGISRRIVNLGYILWVLTLSLIVLCLFLILEVSILAAQIKKNRPKIDVTVPHLLQSINANGLFFFILSNLLTGSINFIFQTLLLGKATSMMIIIAYMAALCGATNYLFLKNIFLKL